MSLSTTASPTGECVASRYGTLESAPKRHNLIDVPSYQEKIKALLATMFPDFEARGGLNAPLRIPAGERLDQRKLP